MEIIQHLHSICLYHYAQSHAWHFLTSLRANLSLFYKCIVDYLKTLSSILVQSINCTFPVIHFYIASKELIPVNLYLLCTST